MKNSVFVGAALLISIGASAYSVKINQLSCSGLGPATGYTTINLTGSNKLTVTSVKYFVSTSDSNVSITDKVLLSNGYVKLDLYSSKFGSHFSLVMSAPVGPAQFITGGGTDLLSCQSNLEVN